MKQLYKLFLRDNWYQLQYALSREYDQREMVRILIHLRKAMDMRVLGVRAGTYYDSDNGHSLKNLPVWYRDLTLLYKHEEYQIIETLAKLRKHKRRMTIYLSERTDFVCLNFKIKSREKDSAESLASIESIGDAIVVLMEQVLLSR